MANWNEYVNSTPVVDIKKMLDSFREQDAADTRYLQEHGFHTTVDAEADEFNMTIGDEDLLPTMHFVETGDRRPDLAEPIMAATAWQSNAELIVDCFKLGYLQVNDLTLDPTYGRGIWWKLQKPDRLVIHDLALDGVDFRALPHAKNTFRRAVFDPPYVCVGGRATTTMPDFHNRYGLTDAPKSPMGLQEMNNLGLAEIYRVLLPKGVVLVKCADYVSSGKLVIGTHRTLTKALELGFELIDRMEHIGRPRPQPPRTRADGQPVRQHHARRNLSTLFVLQKG